MKFDGYEFVGYKGIDFIGCPMEKSKPSFSSWLLYSSIDQIRNDIRLEMTSKVNKRSQNQRKSHY